MENVMVRKNPMESRIKFHYEAGIKSIYYKFHTIGDAIIEFKEKALALFLEYEKLQRITDEKPFFAYVKELTGIFDADSDEVTYDFLRRFYFQQGEVYEVERVSNIGAYLKSKEGFNSYFFKKEDLIYIYFDFDGWDYI